MDNHLQKQQIQITDLVSEAVLNAKERRNLAEITELSEQESKDIHGGVGIVKIIIGLIFNNV